MDGYDSGAFLAAVLERVECQVAEAGGFRVTVDSHDAALLAWLFVIIIEGEGGLGLLLLLLWGWLDEVGDGVLGGEGFVGEGGAWREGGGGGFWEGFGVEERE